LPPTRLPKFSFLALACLFVLAPLSPSLHAQTSAAEGSVHLPALSPLSPPHRPAGVPENYVITPFGYFHPSCVQSIADDQTLLADGRIQHRDGSADATVPSCKFPRFAPNGSPVKSPVSNPQVNGWIESASIVPDAATDSYSSLLSLFTVPPIPHRDDGQLLYFFPGLEDIVATQSILQPVLQYYGKQWAVANWNCCLNNITTESKLIKVSPGDKIFGTITADCPPGTNYCAKWTVFSLDLHTGTSTTLKNTPADGQVFNWAFGAVMEPYYVVNCGDYPPNHEMDFEVLVFDEHWRFVVSPKWQKGINTTQKPQCNYGIAPTPYDVTLTY
jgi:hypothetical protein